MKAVTRLTLVLASGLTLALALGPAPPSPRVTLGRVWPPADLIPVDRIDHGPWGELLKRYVDDRGGVQPPKRYDVEYWGDDAWRAVAGAKKAPEEPTGGQFNEVRFGRVKASKVRVVFTHAGMARSGVSELLVWNE